MYGYSALSSIESGTHALSRRGGRYSDHAWPCHIGSSRHSLCCESLSEERSAGNPHATFCGSRRWVTASGDPVNGPKRHESRPPRLNVGCWWRSGPRSERPELRLLAKLRHSSGDFRFRPDFVGLYEALAVKVVLVCVA